MSTQTVARQPFDIPPVAEIVDSEAVDVSIALRKFDERSANSTHIHLPAHTAKAMEDWMQPAPLSSSLGRKGGALAIVALVHVVAVAVFAQMAPPTQERSTQPLQVVSIAAPLAEEDTPPPPPPQRLPEIALPVEPLIDIAITEPTNAITVAMRPVESTAPSRTSSVTAPKMVSSVDYIREPVAKYPAAARALKQRGVVTLRALIDQTGHAREVNVHQSSGFRLLDDTARQAVLKALFKPYTENGLSIPVYVLIPIEFGTAS
jgi:protein TonB